MAALAAAGAAVAGAIVGMGVFLAMVMQMLVVVGMGMVMGMGMAMRMGVGNAVMGMLVGMLMSMLVGVGTAGDMIVMNMHVRFSFAFFLYYSRNRSICQNIYFCRNIPHRGLRKRRKRGIMAGKLRLIPSKEASPMSDYRDHIHFHTQGIPHSHGHVHENQKAVVNRLARAIGHLEKVKRMVEDGYDCSEVLIQLSAVRSALDNTGKVILKDHIRHCMVDAVAAGDDSAIDDLCQAVDKFMK